jgi:hypothetical protein
MNPAMLKMVNELAAVRAGAGAPIENVLEEQIKLLADLRQYAPKESELSESCSVFIQNSQNALSVLRMMKPYQEKVSP